MEHRTQAVVINVVAENCNSCHACIQACPVKFCNNASNDIVQIDPDLCIGCGACLSACTHQARVIVDDLEEAMQMLLQGNEMVAITAPAVASVFPDTYLHLNGWLHSLGVKAVFDVSFGAELTVKTYLDYLESSGTEHLIAQPCPAIVSYIETWSPELLPYLSPGDSPMAHTMKMIHEFYPQYKDKKILVISPCTAKKREFESIGLGDFNVTMKHLQEYLEKKRIRLGDYPATEYINPPAERAVEFSNPGGLLETAEREHPGIRRQIRKIEGPESIYPYLKDYRKNVEKGCAPLLLDCLNCEKGCNGGTGTGRQEESTDALECSIYSRSEIHQKKVQSRKEQKEWKRNLEKYWKKDLYIRQYKDRSSAIQKLKQPGPEELEHLYQEMLKTNKEDIMNCASCGYNSCESMAFAIFNGLNKKENCHFYASKRYIQEHDQRIHTLGNLNTEMKNASTEVRSIENIILTLERQSEESEKLLQNINKMVHSLEEMNGVTREKSSEVVTMTELTQLGKKRLLETSGKINQTAQNITSMLSRVSEINEISQHTNVLAINAAIQAARYGSVGESFAVIAREIRELADQSFQNTSGITQNLEESAEWIIQAQESEKVTQSAFLAMEKQLNQITRSFSELLERMDAMLETSDTMKESMEAFDHMFKEMKSESKRIEDTTGKLDSIFDNVESITRKEEAGQEHLQEAAAGLLKK